MRIHVHLHNELWNLIRTKIDVIPMPEAELKCQGEQIRGFFHAYVATFLRLRVLHEQGGIHADMARLFVAPFPRALFEVRCVMGHERLDRDSPSAAEGSLCNTVIKAEPGSAIIGHWIERMLNAFDESWSNHNKSGGSLWDPGFELFAQAPRGLDAFSL